MISQRRGTRTMMWFQNNDNSQVSHDILKELKRSFHLEMFDNGQCEPSCQLKAYHRSTNVPGI